MSRKLLSSFVILIAFAIPTASLHAWGAQGHRIIGLLAAKHLSAVARQNVAWLLDGQSLADVSSWADQQVLDVQQTAPWHYLNIPPTATGYDRDRDCPRQPGVAAGARADRWRDCVVDRIAYFEQRLADRALDRADRATALKFLVHFVEDVHQPFHALGVGRGGNDVLVRVFGVSNCSNDPARESPCNLHSVWDTRLIAHRELDDAAYVSAVERIIKEKDLGAKAAGAPGEWAVESWAMGKAALVPLDSNIDEAYYRAQISVVDERLGLAAVRLAAVLNRALTGSPPQ